MERREFLAGLLLVATMYRAHAQQSGMPVIGHLSPGSPESDSSVSRVPVSRHVAIWQGLSEMGYVEGRNVVIEYRWAEGHYDRLPVLAADLVSRQVAVIVTAGISAALAAKAATSTIPIVFNFGVDPVAIGLVTSLNHPGGNATGVAQLAADLVAKRLELIHDLVPGAAAAALLVNPTNLYASEAETRGAQDAARSLGLHVYVLQASTASEIETAFWTLVERRAGAFVVSADAFLLDQRAQIVALAARHAVPEIYAWREYVMAGGLISYSTSLAEAYRQIGMYVGRILKGEKPANLPVQQVAKTELVINLKDLLH